MYLAEIKVNEAWNILEPLMENAEEGSVELGYLENIEERLCEIIDSTAQLHYDIECIKVKR